MKDVFEREGLCPVITFGDRGMMEFEAAGMAWHARSAGPNKREYRITPRRKKLQREGRSGTKRREGGRKLGFL